MHNMACMEYVYMYMYGNTCITIWKGVLECISMCKCWCTYKCMSACTSAVEMCTSAEKMWQAYMYAICDSH